MMVETELRLGLPGGKRVFSEMAESKIEFKAAEEEGGGAAASAGEMKNFAARSSLLAAAESEKPPAPKAQVVGWPPVRSFRRNILSGGVAEKDGGGKEDEKSKSGGAPPPPAAALVKVSMDGAPYLRKVDLKNLRSYDELSKALEDMFGSFSTPAENGKRDGDSHQLRDFMSEKKKKAMDLLKGSDYVPTYEDKDGDWMLVGDVPWEMFANSCKRLRIMRCSEAVGLVPGGKNKD